MTTPVDAALIERLADLAQLELSPDDVVRATTELAAIIAYVDKLAEVDTDGIEATAHVQLDRLTTRQDELRPSLDRERVLAEAPEATEAGFSVPSFVDQG